jgi:hypothetical protein
MWQAHRIFRNLEWLKTHFSNSSSYSTNRSGLVPHSVPNGIRFTGHTRTPPRPRLTTTTDTPKPRSVLSQWSRISIRPYPQYLIPSCYSKTSQSLDTQPDLLSGNSSVHQDSFLIRPASQWLSYPGICGTKLTEEPEYERRTLPNSQAP